MGRPFTHHLPFTDCIHCGRRFNDARKYRRLCWPCRVNPAVRSLYPPKNKHGRRGVALSPGKALPEPTSARPGTPEKIEVLATRAAAGQQLYHPLDARF